MIFVIFLLTLLALLIIVSIINTFIFIALKLITSHHYREKYLILPSLLSFLLWSLTYFAMFEVVRIITKNSLFDIVYKTMLKTENFRAIFPNIILPIVIVLVITLILQAFVLLTVNINYEKLKNKFMYFMQKKFKFIKAKETNEVVQVEERFHLTFVNAYVAGLFIFSFLFFLNIMFFWLGTSIGVSIIL